MWSRRFRTVSIWTTLITTSHNVVFFWKFCIRITPKYSIWSRHLRWSLKSLWSWTKDLKPSSMWKWASNILIRLLWTRFYKGLFGISCSITVSSWSVRRIKALLWNCWKGCTSLMIKIYLGAINITSRCSSSESWLVHLLLRVSISSSWHKFALMCSLF